MQLNKIAFVSALNVFAQTTASAVQTLYQSAVKAGFHHWEDAEPVVIEWAAQRYGCATKVSESPRNKGAVVLDSTSKGYDAAKTTVRRVREALVADEAAKAGVTRSDKADVEIPEDIAKLAAKLVALCNEYEGAKRLAAQAVAQAFAAAK